MKQIDLLEILIKHIPTELYDPSLDKYYLAALKEACEATVDLCAKNARLDYDNGNCRECGANMIDQESILKVKKLIV